MKELLLGCGHSRTKRLGWPQRTWNVNAPNFEDLTTVDNVMECNPDLLGDLDCSIWQFQARTLHAVDCMDDNGTTIKSDYFDEVHAYEVLEHLGRQGDYKSFFNTFYNIYRVLVPNGLLFATCPSRYSGWLWGDPGHTRAVIPQSLSFLDQANYAECGKTSRSDFRAVWSGDFKCELSSDADKETHVFILRAIKPRRYVKTYAEEKGLI
jgi:hypothetical protein